MTDTVVSVRMPTSLVKELKQLAVVNHFKDLSEEIRSVVRAKCIEYTEPSYTPELQKLREDLSIQLDIKKKQAHKQQLMQDLQKVMEQLKNEK
ncbi:hypothetical protein H8D36_04245 [archaeon]|nr:hypothetical protein [archaeon]MBL7057392.1 hypothetical protein [Candidatus Woesearchaeota archaeon]